MDPNKFDWATPRGLVAIKTIGTCQCHCHKPNNTVVGCISSFVDCCQFAGWGLPQWYRELKKERYEPRQET